jgi:hypothetical protein
MCRILAHDKTVSEVETLGSNWILRIEPLQVGLVPLRNTPESFPFSHVKTKQNRVCLEARKQALTRHCIGQHFDLGLLIFQYYEKEMSGIYELNSL